MEQNVENKIKLESDVAELKRQYKHAHTDLVNIKAETAEVIATKDRVNNEVIARKEELQEVLNMIHKEKLDWMNQRHVELEEVEKKQADVQNVMNWKADLNKREEEMRKIIADDIEIRNETRRTELKIEGDKVDMDVRERAIKERETNLVTKENKIDKDKKSFKENAIKIIQEVEKL